MKKYLNFTMLVAGLMALLMLVGCGASKTYVDQAVAEERASRETAVSGVDSDVKAQKAILERLQSLTTQLEQKTDMAINQAKGFESYVVVWEGEVYFDFNSSEITMEAAAIMDQAGDKMVSRKTAVMEIAGYTDPSGSTDYNMELGQKRATSAKYYLVDHYGVNLYRIFFVSYGENKSVSTGENKASYAKQRKVTLKIWDKP